jgi:hypothetical protein
MEELKSDGPNSDHLIQLPLTVSVREETTCFGLSRLGLAAGGHSLRQSYGIGFTGGRK